MLATLLAARVVPVDKQMQPTKTLRLTRVTVEPNRFVDLEQLPNYVSDQRPGLEALVQAF